MSEPLPVEFTTLAAQQIRTAEGWWRVKRTAAPNALQLELEHALTLIARQRRIGSRASDSRIGGVRRVFLPVIKQYLYLQRTDGIRRVLAATAVPKRRITHT